MSNSHPASELTDRPSRILDLAAGYRLFGRLVRGGAWRLYLDEYVKPVPGEKVLDMGCGPGDIFDWLPGVNYTGFDINPAYIASARKRFGGRARFDCSDVALVSIERERGSFDLALATGVIHHLDDARALKLFQLARLALRPGGRLITFDGCYVPGQSKVARWLLRNDRGRFVRTLEEYVRLASSAFSKVKPDIRHDLLRIPYTHAILRCSN